LYRRQEDDAKAEKVLRKAIKVAPDNADAHYAPGLSLVRQKKNDKAFKLLQRAADFDTSNAHYVYVYAVALHSTGKKDMAIEILQEANIRFPLDIEILNALIAFHRDAGNEFAM